MLVFDQSSQLANLVEIRLAKKFSVCFSILVSSQALSKVFWKARQLVIVLLNVFFLQVYS